MPATCVELMLSRRIVHGESAEFQYLVQGTDSEADALAAVLAAAPASYVFTVDGVTVTLPRQAPELEPLHVTSGDGMWQAQTPQMFRYGLLRKVLEGNSAVTDEAGAIEAAGLQPRLVRADSTNLKVTFPTDLLLAEYILKGRRT